MLCEECGSDTAVKETYDDGTTVHRKRQCVNQECQWRCVTQEKFVDDYYSPTALRRRNQSQRDQIDL